MRERERERESKTKRGAVAVEGKRKRWGSDLGVKTYIRNTGKIAPGGGLGVEGPDTGNQESLASIWCRAGAVRG